MSTEGSATDVTFSSVLSFADGASRLDVIVIATGCDGESTSRMFHVRRDATAPVVAVDEFAPAPTENRVLYTPVALSGTVTEANIASFTVAGQPVGLVPTAADTFTFVIDVPLTRGQTRTVEIVAVDTAGNEARREVIFFYDAQVDVDIVAPESGSTVIVTATPADVAIEVLVPGRGSHSVVASVDGGAEFELSGTDLVTGTASLDEGTHALQVHVVDTVGTTVASAQSTFEVVTSANVPLEVVSVAPEADGWGVETTEPIRVRFNRPIADPALVDIVALETVHGEVYTRQAFGSSIGPTTEIYERIDHDREPVFGVIELAADNASALFIPSREWHFGAQIYVDVSYDTVSLSRTRFDVRETPTLLTGFLTDSSGGAVRDVTVAVPELGLTTTTSETGSYGFGYGFGQETNELPAGRHRVVYNPGRNTPDLATVERFVTVDANRATRLDPVSLPSLSRAATGQIVSSGEVAVMDEGRLILDFSNASLRFAGGARQGDLLLQRILAIHAPYPTATRSIRVDWLYVNVAESVALTGPIDVTIQLPSSEERPDYWEVFGPYMAILALNRSSGVMEIVGFGALDSETGVVTSVQPIEVSSLDAFGSA